VKVPLPARGRLRLCGTCGGVVAFVELYGDGRVSELEGARLTLATKSHFFSSPACKDGGTFEGVDVAACRCGAPLRLERPKGLFCAKCNGLIAPHLRPATRPPFEERSCRRR
jgi:hypothetical protein